MSSYFAHKMVYIDPGEDFVQALSAIEPVLLSSLAHCLLQGIILCQLVSFWQKGASDSKRLKLFVCTIFMLCSVQTCAQVYKVWVITVSQENWARSPARYIEFPLNSVICSAVQAFLVRRVWKVTGRRWVVLIPLGMLFLAIFGAWVTMAVTINRFIQSPGASSTSCGGLPCIPEFSAWLWGSTVLDASITVALSVYFLRSKTGYHHLDAVLTRIWNLTLITAALPMATMLAAVSLFYATGRRHYHYVTALVIIAGKLYFNGLLRNLNVRDKLKASLQANALGRRSIVTIGSDPQRNTRHESPMTAHTLMEDNVALVDVEKLAGSEDFHMERSRYNDQEGSDLRKYAYNTRAGDRWSRGDPRPWPVHQTGVLYHSLTF